MFCVIRDLPNGNHWHDYVPKDEIIRGGLKPVTLNRSNAKSTFVQSTQMQTFLKTIQTQSCWYSLESSRGALSDEYPFARVSVIFRIFASFCIGQISHHQLKG